MGRKLDSAIFWPRRSLQIDLEIRSKISLSHLLKILSTDSSYLGAQLEYCLRPFFFYRVFTENQPHNLVDMQLNMQKNEATEKLLLSSQPDIDVL